MSKAPSDDRPTSRGALLLALGASVIIGSFIPFGRLVLYPFTLMATWVHEMGHGVGALLSGGGFESLDVFANGSGLAHTFHTPGAEGFVCAAGLLAPPLLGAAMLGTARGPRRARLWLTIFAAAMVVSLVIWVRSVAGFISLPLVAAVVAAFARWGSPREVLFFAHFLGLRLAADTVTSIDYIFTDEAMVDGVVRASDIARVAEAWGGPRFMWSLIIAAVSLLLVGVGLWAAFRAHRQEKSRGR